MCSISDRYPHCSREIWTRVAIGAGGLGEPGARNIPLKLHEGVFPSIACDTDAQYTAACWIRAIDVRPSRLVRYLYEMAPRDSCLYLHGFCVWHRSECLVRSGYDCPVCMVERASLCGHRRDESIVDRDNCRASELPWRSNLWVYLKKLWSDL